MNVPRPVRVTVDTRNNPTTVTDGGDDAERPDERNVGSISPSPQRTRSVNDILEIWHIDDEWWRIPICRRYVEVVLEGGRHVVLFQDLNTGEWFEQKP